MVDFEKKPSMLFCCLPVEEAERWKEANGSLTLAVVVRIVANTLPLKQWDVARELRRRIKNSFDEEGIEIPYPHMKVYMGQES